MIVVLLPRFVDVVLRQHIRRHRVVDHLVERESLRERRF